MKPVLGTERHDKSAITQILSAPGEFAGASATFRNAPYYQMTERQEQNDGTPGFTSRD